MGSDRWQDLLLEVRACDWQRDAEAVQEILEAAVACAGNSAVLPQLQQALELYPTDSTAASEVVAKILDDIDDAQALLMLGAAAPAEELPPPPRYSSSGGSRPSAPRKRPAPAATKGGGGGTATAAKRAHLEPPSGAPGSTPTAQRLPVTKTGGLGGSGGPSLGSRSGCYPQGGAFPGGEGGDRGRRLGGGSRTTWYGLLQNLLLAAERGGPPITAGCCSQLAALAEADAAARAAGAGEFFAGLAAQGLSAEALEEVLRVVLNQVVRPMWARCCRCRARRLVRTPPTADAFTCGDAAALYGQRRCGAPDDLVEEWRVTSDTAVLRVHVDASWFVHAQLEALVAGVTAAGALQKQLAVPKATASKSRPHLAAPLRAGTDAAAAAAAGEGEEEEEEGGGLFPAGFVPKRRRSRLRGRSSSQGGDSGPAAPGGGGAAAGAPAAGRGGGLGPAGRGRDATAGHTAAAAGGHKGLASAARPGGSTGRGSEGGEGGGAPDGLPAIAVQLLQGVMARSKGASPAVLLAQMEHLLRSGGVPRETAEQLLQLVAEQLDLEARLAAGGMRPSRWPAGGGPPPTSGAAPPPSTRGAPLLPREGFPGGPADPHQRGPPSKGPPGRSGLLQPKEEGEGGPPGLATMARALGLPAGQGPPGLGGRGGNGGGGGRWPGPGGAAGGSASSSSAAVARQLLEELALQAQGVGHPLAALAATLHQQLLGALKAGALDERLLQAAVAALAAARGEGGRGAAGGGRAAPGLALNAREGVPMHFSAAGSSRRPGSSSSGGRGPWQQLEASAAAAAGGGGSSQPLDLGALGADPQQLGPQVLHQLWDQMVRLQQAGQADPAAMGQLAGLLHQAVAALQREGVPFELPPALQGQLGALGAGTVPRGSSSSRSPQAGGGAATPQEVMEVAAAVRAAGCQVRVVEPGPGRQDALLLVSLPPHAAHEAVRGALSRLQRPGLQIEVQGVAGGGEGGRGPSQLPPPPSAGGGLLGQQGGGASPQGHGAVREPPPVSRSLSPPGGPLPPGVRMLGGGMLPPMSSTPPSRASPPAAPGGRQEGQGRGGEGTKEAALGPEGAAAVQALMGQLAGYMSQEGGVTEGQLRAVMGQLQGLTGQYGSAVGMAAIQQMEQLYAGQGAGQAPPPNRAPPAGPPPAAAAPAAPTAAGGVELERVSNAAPAGIKPVGPGRVAASGPPPAAPPPAAAAAAAAASGGVNAPWLQSASQEEVSRLTAHLGQVLRSSAAGSKMHAAAELLLSALKSGHHDTAVQLLRDVLGAGPLSAELLAGAGGEEAGATITAGRQQLSTVQQQLQQQLTGLHGMKSDLEAAGALGVGGLGLGRGGALLPGSTRVGQGGHHPRGSSKSGSSSTTPGNGLPPGERGQGVGGGHREVGSGRPLAAAGSDAPGSEDKARGAAAAAGGGAGPGMNGLRAVGLGPAAPGSAPPGHAGGGGSPRALLRPAVVPPAPGGLSVDWSSGVAAWQGVVMCRAPAAGEGLAGGSKQQQGGGPEGGVSGGGEGDELVELFSCSADLPAATAAALPSRLMVSQVKPRSSILIDLHHNDPLILRPSSSCSGGQLAALRGLAASKMAAVVDLGGPSLVLCPESLSSKGPVLVVGVLCAAQEQWATAHSTAPPALGVGLVGTSSSGSSGASFDLAALIRDIRARDAGRAPPPSSTAAPQQQMPAAGTAAAEGGGGPRPPPVAPAAPAAAAPAPVPVSVQLVRDGSEGQEDQRSGNGGSVEEAAAKQQQQQPAVSSSRSASSRTQTDGRGGAAAGVGGEGQQAESKPAGGAGGAAAAAPAAATLAAVEASGGDGGGGVLGKLPGQTTGSSTDLKRARAGGD